ncbi:NAD(P)-binding domain-containing protein [Actinoplanes sp. NEAU-A12]|uniref:NAD(P)-binding domain-containing protein n=1 Tax=Actinoplanes sandaracinus TaxID=3045177 RepID=A0ABT6WMQ3_9ACTN|nr:NAD(P)-binding domain-containing protein [Actinoplanes sandaracinus]MDI6101018.1 NAD(P)-binding domain-containing protein [Actinoplanes sandaracinus]
MRIGVIGAGQLGGTLARWCAESGHDVAVTSRHPERLRKQMDHEDVPLRVMAIPQAAAFADVIIFSPNWSSAHEAVEMTRGVIADKVVIDATNPDVPESVSGLEILMDWAPEAHWAKAFNTVSTDVLSRRRGHDPLLTEYVCTDQRDAREATAQIIRDIGFAPVYAGGAHAALLTETGGPLRMREVDVKDATDALAEALAVLH